MFVLKHTSLFNILSQYSTAQWFLQNPLPTGNGFCGVSFHDVNSGTAIGDAETIIKTINNRQTQLNQKIKGVTIIIKERLLK